MTDSIFIRNAGRDDIPFLVKIILLSETSGFELISYREMFKDLPEEEFLACFHKTLDNDFDGHALSYKSFLIAEVNEVPAAAASGYIEGESGNSNLLMTGALMNGFPKEAVLTALHKNAAFLDINFKKKEASLQLDSVATLPEFRKRGLISAIFYKHYELAKVKQCNLAEIQVWKGNLTAISAYQSLGFFTSSEKSMNIPGSAASEQGKLLMHKLL